MEELEDTAYLNYKSRGKSQIKTKTRPKVWYSKGANPSTTGRGSTKSTKSAKRGHARAKRHDLINSCKTDKIDSDVNVKRLHKRIVSKMSW